MKKVRIIDADTIFGKMSRKDTDISLDRLLSVMKANGVAESLTLSAKGIFYSDKEGNAETLFACAKHKNLIPVATLNPKGYIPGEKLVKKIKKDGFCAVRFFPDHQGWPVEYLPFISLLNEIEDEGLPLIFPCGPLGTATTLLRVLGKRKIKVIMSSVGYAQLSEVLCAVKENKRFFAMTKLFNTPDGLELVAEAGGIGRLVLGSGQPHDFFGNSASMIMKMELPGKEKILGKNILGIIGK